MTSWDDPAAELVGRLRAFTDAQLAAAERDASQSVAERVLAFGDFDTALDDAAFQMQWSLAVMLQNEQTRREVVLESLEADLAGGHRVYIVEDRGTWAAYCLPRPDGGYDPCWEGEDRQTVEEAVEDGRRHNPGFEPVVNGPHLHPGS